MHFFIFILLICFFIFLFSLYLLVRDDFVLIRKDMTTERVFNIAFIIFVASIFCARVLYAILNWNGKFLNPLIFILFPYYPGLSMVGGVVGGVMFLLLLSKFRKIPIARLLDFFSISFLSAYPFGLLGYFLLSKVNILAFKPITLFLVHILIFIIFLKIFLPRLLNGTFKDGTIGLLFLISFSVISLVENFVGGGGGKVYFSFEDLILLVMFVVSIVFVFRQERILSRIKKLKKIKRL